MHSAIYGSGASRSMMMIFHASQAWSQSFSSDLIASLRTTKDLHTWNSLMLKPISTFGIGVPYRILEDFKNSSYRFDLPAELKRRGVHPSFHASLLRAHHPNDDRRFPSRQLERHVGIGDSESAGEWKVDKITDHHGKGKDTIFYLRWVSGDCAWFPYHEVAHLEALTGYLEAQGAKSVSDLPRKVSGDSPDDPQIFIGTTRISDRANPLGPCSHRSSRDIVYEIADDTLEAMRVDLNTGEGPRHHPIPHPSSMNNAPLTVTYDPEVLDTTSSVLQISTRTLSCHLYLDTTSKAPIYQGGLHELSPQMMGDATIGPRGGYHCPSFLRYPELRRERWERKRKRLVSKPRPGRKKQKLPYSSGRHPHHPCEALAVGLEVVFGHERLRIIHLLVVKPAGTCAVLEGGVDVVDSSIEAEAGVQEGSLIGHAYPAVPPRIQSTVEAAPVLTPQTSSTPSADPVASGKPSGTIEVDSEMADMVFMLVVYALTPGGWRANVYVSDVMLLIDIRVFPNRLDAPTSSYLVQLYSLVTLQVHAVLSPNPILLLIPIPRVLPEMTLAPPAAPYWLSEHQWEGSKRAHHLSSENRQTILSVVFHEETRSRFSAICIVLCCRSEIYEEKWRGWDIQQVDSTSHTSRDEDDALSELDCHPPFNDPALPKCVVVFEVLSYEAPKRMESTPIDGKVVLRATDYLELLGNDSVRILLKTERSLTPDTLSVSSRFTHSPKLYTTRDLRSKPASRYNLMRPLKFQITRVVRVLPTASALPGITNGGLPTEILLQIFREVARATVYSGRRRDLLAFGLVCRKWTCSLDLLLWDFQGRGLPYSDTWPPNIHALGKAVTERPALGLSIRQFSTATFMRPSLLGFVHDGDDIPSNPGFTSDVVAIEAVASALYDLHKLHTFTLGVPYPVQHTGGGGGIGFVELAHCLARWPALKSLGVNHLHLRPTIMEPATLPLPVCALTKLVMTDTRLSDSELMHIMSSLKTLEHVVFDTIYGVTNASIRTFLDVISHSLTSLSILRTPARRDDVAQDERALDATIDKMGQTVHRQEK
ncbi:hypothetical protein BU15DRAFT_74107 [Melanogaster broomeanus]|nr:hypothetical protein BU15DRAFT_74107 [Melanogaster broomeanus]